MEHLTSRVSGVNSEWRMLLYVYINFFRIFLFFIQKNCAFIIFNVFHSNFRNRALLTNQKRELVIRNCLWNCMFVNNRVWKINNISNGASRLAPIKENPTDLDTRWVPPQNLKYLRFMGTIWNYCLKNERRTRCILVRPSLQTVLKLLSTLVMGICGEF